MYNELMESCEGHVNDDLAAIIALRGVTNSYAESNSIILEDTKRTRLVAMPYAYDNNKGTGVGCKLFRYRKDSSGNTKPLSRIHFNNLHENDSIEIRLRSDAAKKLFEHMDRLGHVVDTRGVGYGNRKYKIADEGSLVINDENKSVIIAKLLERNYGNDFWSCLQTSDANLATHLAYAKIQSDRAVALDTFRNMLSGDFKECEWQKFFESNQWIFGYGLCYKFMTQAYTQPVYSGANVSKSGAQRGDFLLGSVADVRFTCLVEIKKPSTRLLGSQYRNDAWPPSDELCGAVSQIQVNGRKWVVEGSRSEDNSALMGDLLTVQPKMFVVIGKLSELDDLSKKRSFELYRNNLSSPEIITYDELYERAKFIVGNDSTKAEP